MTHTPKICIACAERKGICWKKWKQISVYFPNKTKRCSELGAKGSKCPTQIGQLTFCDSLKSCCTKASRLKDVHSFVPPSSIILCFCSEIYNTIVCLPLPAGAFGGDASQLTLMGQGYGAVMVNLLLISPVTRGTTQNNFAFQHSIIVCCNFSPVI